MAIDRLPTGRVSVSWQRHLQPIMQPAVVGNVAVTIVRTRGDQLDILGLDVADGHALWRFPFYTPDESRSPDAWQPVFTSASGRRYAVFQRAQPGAPLGRGARKPYLAVDPATGHVVARTRPLVGYWPPATCDGSVDSADVCLQVGAKGSELRWDLGDFTLHRLRDPHGAGQDGVYQVIGGTQGVFVVGRDAPGHPRWRRRVKGLVGPHWVVDGRSASPYVGQGVVVLSASRLPSASQEHRYDRGDRVPVDRASRRTLGLDLDTGRVLWKHDGAELHCPSVSDADAPVRCAFTGRLLYDRSWHGPRLQHLRLSIEGFEPHTGDTTWSVPLSPRAARDEAGQLLEDPWDADRGSVVGQAFGWLRGMSGPRVIAWRDGSSRPVGADTVALCHDWRRFPYATDTSTLPLRYTDTYRLCSVDRRSRVTGAPAAAGLAVAGAAAPGGRYVVSFADRVDAYFTGPVPGR